MLCWRRRLRSIGSRSKHKPPFVRFGRVSNTSLHPTRRSFRFFTVYDWYITPADLLCKLLREVYLGAKQAKGKVAGKTNLDLTGTERCQLLLSTWKMVPCTAFASTTPCSRRVATGVRIFSCT